MFSSHEISDNSDFIFNRVTVKKQIGNSEFTNSEVCKLMKSSQLYLKSSHFFGIPDVFVFSSFSLNWLDFPEKSTFFLLGFLSFCHQRKDQEWMEGLVLDMLHYENVHPVFLVQK